MELVRVEGFDDCIRPLAERLGAELQAGQQVLWLVPGGSNVPLSVQVMAQLAEEQTAQLTILLSDERFGPVGHADSNLQQLTNAGFQSKRATIVPVLAAGFGLEETRQRYDQAVQAALDRADTIIGQFGMGEDGHIAGILPGSPAVSSADLVAAYEAPPLTRITLTPKALQDVTAAYLCAFGAAKRPALENLQSHTLSLVEQPAQLLKQLPEAYVYNDQIGENS